MDDHSLWNTFAKTGKVDDYLRYRQAVNAVTPPQTKEGGTADPQNRRPHREGEQSG